MDSSIPAELLVKSHCFGCVEPSVLELLAEQMTPASLKEGEELFHEGEDGDCLYLIQSGELVVTKQTPEGDEVQIAVLREDECVGEMSLLDPSPRSASVRATGACCLWRLDRQPFEALLEKNPGICRALLACLSERLRRENQAVVSLQTSEMDRRVPVAVFDTKPYIEQSFRQANEDRYGLKFFTPRLNRDTAVLAGGFKAVCVFVNDSLDAETVAILAGQGVGLIALRCAGYNNVDLAACQRLGLSVARVPAYSPHAVAEHAAALMLCLNRRLHRAHGRVREGNFSLDGLVGFDMYGKTAGVVGTGRIGRCIIDILLGLGCRVLAYNRSRNEDLARRPGVRLVDMDQLLSQSDIITLHVPLTGQTHHIIDAGAIARMKPGVMLINTGRGGLVDTVALIDGLKTSQIGSTGLDVYEEESGYFFEDFSDSVISDDTLARLLTFPNVLVTSHQGFLTREALAGIANTTLDNITEFCQGRRGTELTNSVCV